MSRRRSRRDLVEIFGYAPDDLTPDVRTLWKLNACPFLGKQCTKPNHDQTVIYGTCSVTAPNGEVIICPNRLYAERYKALRKVVSDCYGMEVPMLMFSEYVERRGDVTNVVVALGTNSGREVKVGQSLSMDWVLALVDKGELIDYVGVEVQSIDIVGNYRDAWHAYKDYTENTTVIPSSNHGLNWANVHKRLIPQLVRKGLVYSRSSFVTHGLFFIVPEIVYQKFEKIIGSDIPTVTDTASDTISVHTYGLGQEVSFGEQRSLQLIREVRFKLDEFASRSIKGQNLPSGEELDRVVRRGLGLLGD